MPPRISKPIKNSLGDEDWDRQPGESISFGEWKNDPRDGLVVSDVHYRFRDFATTVVAFIEGAPLNNRDGIAKTERAWREAVIEARVRCYIASHQAA